MRLAHNKKKDFINQSEFIIWCKKIKSFKKKITKHTSDTTEQQKTSSV